MPEVPENMQENIAYLESQAQSPVRATHYQSQSQYPLQNYSIQNQPNDQRAVPHDHGGYYTDNGSMIPQYGHQQLASQGNGLQNYSQSINPEPLDQPNFSPFPILRNIPPNVPPTDEQREGILEAAREAVLGSNDPETQLTWAQDALAYVEVAMQNEQRLSAIQPPRPQTPRVEHVLKEDAMKIVSFLSDQRHPKAEFLKGTWLEFGKFGYRIDKKEAFHCYNRAIEKGYARAYYRIGMQFEQSNDALKAIRYYQMGADAGDAAACYRLGMMSLLGQHGQPQDYARGLSLISSSALTADENAPQGAYVFGMLQARELAQVSIPERFLALDVNGARINIEKSAYLGFPKAQVKMGAAYELCEMQCDFSPALSLHYYALAARQGEPDAEMAISKWFLCGHEGLFEKNEEMAFTYAQRAAQSGLATAQFALGYFYEVGINVSVNLKEAREWYTRAAANGNKDATGRIESISRSKTISRKDHESIAVSKIREQRGSERQSKPAAPNLPIAPAIDMPDPSRLSLNPNRHHPNPSGPQRPPSVAPYPTNGDEQPRPGSTSNVSNFSSPEIRPTSAFGINPNLRPTSASTIAGTRPDGHRQSATYNNDRYYSSADAGAPGYGSGNRIPSGQGPQGRPQPRPGATPSPLAGGPLKQSAGPQPPMKVDIGFTAPLDASGADRRQRNQRPNDPNANKPQPALPAKFKDEMRPPRKSSKSPITSYPSNPPAAGRPNQPRQDENQQPAPVANNKPLPGTALGKPPANAARPMAAISNGRPPGKGPKTFEEMGVPQGKADSDCVSRSDRAR